MNNFTIVCNNRVFKDKFINDIKEKNNIDDRDVILLSEKDFDEAVYELDSYSLFSAKKLVVLSHPNLKSSYENISKYLDNSSDNILLIVINELSKKDIKLNKLLSKTKIIYDNLDLDEYIKEAFKPFDVSKQIIKFLRNYLSDNKDLIANEINKIKLYTLPRKEISINDIIKVSTKFNEYNVFDLINSFLAKNGKETYDKYQTLSKNEDGFFMIMPLLRDSLIIMRNALLLKNQYSSNDIINKLKVNEYRYKNIMKYAYNFTLNELDELINELNDLEIHLKRGRSVNSLFSYYLFNIGGISFK